jgi:hypothetical protein
MHFMGFEADSQNRGSSVVRHKIPNAGHSKNLS